MRQNLLTPVQGPKKFTETVGCGPESTNCLETMLFQNALFEYQCPAHMRDMSSLPEYDLPAGQYFSSCQNWILSSFLSCQSL